MREEEVEFENKGDKIVGLLSSPDLGSSNLVILAHGFAANMNIELYKKLAHRLVENGYAAYRFNYRFISDSYENFHKITFDGEVDDLKLVIGKFSKRYKNIGVVGESLGGAVSILSYSSQVKCLVLFYPAIFFKNDIRKEWSSEEKIRELNEKGYFSFVKRSTGQILHVGKKFTDGMSSIDDILQEIPKIKCPIMFIHGDSDRTVSYTESGRAFKVANRPKRIEIVKGAEHGFKDDNYMPSEKLQDKAIVLTIEWFKKWLK